MNPTHKMLAGLLVVQLGLIGLTWSNRRRPSAPAGAVPLVEGSLEDVSAFEVTAKPASEDAEPATVRLEKKDDAWVVASAGDYPAKEEQVEKVLKQVLDIRVKTPLATKKANHNPLRVGERDYDRRVKLVVGGTTHELVVGSAKGTSVHVRKASADEVYWARGVSTWNLSERVSSYVDTSYVDVKDPVELQVKNAQGAFTLSKDADGDWKVSTLEGQPLKQSEITSFVQKAKRVTLDRPVGKDVKDEYGLADGARIVLKYKEGEGEEAEDKQLAYSVGAEVDGKYYLKADAKEHVVTASKWSVEKLLEVSAEDFVKKPEDDAAGTGDGGMPPGIPGLPGGGPFAPPNGP